MIQRIRSVHFTELYFDSELYKTMYLGSLFPGIRQNHKYFFKFHLSSFFAHSINKSKNMIIDNRTVQVRKVWHSFTNPSLLAQAESAGHQKRREKMTIPHVHTFS